MQLAIYYGRFRIYNPRLIQCTKHPKTQWISSSIHWIHLCAVGLSHGQSVHEKEAAGLFDGLECLLRRYEWTLDLLLLMKF